VRKLLDPAQVSESSLVTNCAQTGNVESPPAFHTHSGRAPFDSKYGDCAKLGSQAGKGPASRFHHARAALTINEDYSLQARVGGPPQMKERIRLV